MEKTFTLVGISTLGKITKFRVANGSLEDRIKVLTRNGHTAIDFMKLDAPQSKADAIATYKAAHPEAAEVHVPTSKDATTKAAGGKTVSVKGDKKKSTTDLATDLLNETSGDVANTAEAGTPEVIQPDAGAVDPEKVPVAA